MTRTMTRPAATLAIVLYLAACSHHTDLQKSSSQDDFGVQMAKMNLWREALFRFKRAVEINPTDAMAHNNLAVAYEANGDFDNARKEYLEALKLDRTNQYIQKNYSRYVEFLSRNRKRQQKDLKSASAATSTAPPPAAASSTGAQPASVPTPPLVDASHPEPPPTEVPMQPMPLPPVKPPGGGR
jgi:Flp pilus assembly protein TadD